MDDANDADLQEWRFSDDLPAPNLVILTEGKNLFRSAWSNGSNSKQIVQTVSSPL